MSCQCVRCGTCNGSGHVWVDHILGYDDLERCEDCDGHGVTEERRYAEEWIYE